MFYTSATPTPAAPAKRFSFDYAIRKLFPSTSHLTFNPLFKATVNAFDIVPRVMYSEFRDPPPITCEFASASATATSTTRLISWCTLAISGCSYSLGGWPMLAQPIVNIGSGCGRWAHWLRDYSIRGRTFAGRYVGIDIDAEAIA
jgi:hypothetical protein